MGQREKTAALTSDQDTTLLKSFHGCHLTLLTEPRLTTTDLEALQHLPQPTTLAPSLSLTQTLCNNFHSSRMLAPSYRSPISQLPVLILGASARKPPPGSL